MNYPSAANMIEPTPSSSPIPTALGMLGSAVHEMGLMADMLVNRLNGVMQPCPPPTAGNERAPLEKVAQQASPMVDELVSLRRRVENIRAQLQDAANRLEV